jgi:hypothetical protein
MTEAELIESSGIYNGLMMGWVSLYFTSLTAFIIAAYLAGSKLTTKQVIFVSSGFFLVSALSTFGAFGTGSLMVQFANEVEAVNPKRSFMANQPTVNLALAVLVFGIFGSLKFMWDVRHPKVE